MGRPKIPAEQKVREGKALEAFFIKQQTTEPELTQESIIGEMGLTSQGLFHQWISGITNIPDKRLIWLGERLSFSPLQLRPQLAAYSGDLPSGEGAKFLLSTFEGLDEEGKASLIKQAELLLLAHNK